MYSYPIRIYTKKELALCYFPDSMPRTAVCHLLAWIMRCTPLYEALVKAGYSKQAKSFTSRQVALIFEYLGEP